MPVGALPSLASLSLAAESVDGRVADRAAARRLARAPRPFLPTRAYARLKAGERKEVERRAAERQERARGVWSEYERADEDSTRPEQCAICLEGFNEAEPMQRLACTHPFHAHCLLGWVEHSNGSLCPVCKQEDPTLRAMRKEAVARAAGGEAPPGETEVEVVEDYPSYFRDLEPVETLAMALDPAGPFGPLYDDEPMDLADPPAELRNWEGGVMFDSTDAQNYLAWIAPTSPEQKRLMLIYLRRLVRRMYSLRFSSPLSARNLYDTIRDTRGHPALDAGFFNMAFSTGPLAIRSNWEVEFDGDDLDGDEGVASHRWYFRVAVRSAHRIVSV